MTDWVGIGRTIIAGSLFFLTSCDRIDERLDRAQDVTSAALQQLMGNPPSSDGIDFERYPIEARALSATFRAADTSSRIAPTRSRYVIGSIVAKPRDLPEAIAVAEAQRRPELAREISIDKDAEARIVVLDEATRVRALSDTSVIERIQRAPVKSRNITVLDPEVIRRAELARPDTRIVPGSQIRQPLGTRPISKPDPELSNEARLQTLPRFSNTKLARRALVQQDRMVRRQMVAEDRMLQTAARYGIAASIQRSRTGQMVIEIGDDALSPTQFQGQRLEQKTVAFENGIQCELANGEQAPRDAQMAMACVLKDLEASGEFEYVEKDYIFDHQMILPGRSRSSEINKFRPNDPLFDLQWHYHDRGAEPGQSAGGSGFVDFWTRAGVQGSQNIVVAVVDTGLQLSHPDIADSPNIARGWDMVTDPAAGNDGDSRDSNPTDPGDACPEAGILEDSFHGTHVAGTIGAASTNNKTGVSGGAWSVKIVPVRALGKCGGRLSDINDAIRWAAGTIPEFDTDGEEVWNENPADIINLSIGLFRSCPASMQDAIDDVTAAGVIVVAAAGNDRVSTEFYAPAGCNNVVTVGSGDARGHMAPYSNFGDAIDLLAPGGDLSRDDNGDGNPDGILSSKVASNCFDPASGKAVEQCFYAFEEGTSMAAPHVSAALALIKAARPDLSPEELVSTLLAGVSTHAPDSCTGPCRQFPGTTPIEPDSEICYRPCGEGALDLSTISLSP
jgi:serine protease